MSSDIDTFRKEAEAFLDEHAARAEHRTKEWGEGSDVLSAYAHRSEEAEATRISEAKRWKATEFDAGFGWLTGPTAHGGAGLTADHQRLYADLRSRYSIPPLDCFSISLGMVAPAILDHGKRQVTDTYVHDMHRGDVLGCQLFSEPGAGSDVGGLTTRAELDGDEWVVNGQKVWTSGAHHADVGLLLARSNPAAPKHKGITAFAVPMKTAGIEVRPLKMMTGGTEFNEVFFNDVRISDDNRLGDVDGGWRVAISVLMNERAGAADDVFGLRNILARLMMMARIPGLGGDDPVTRQRLASLYCRAECIRYQSLAADARRNAGLGPGPAESAFKLATTDTMREAVDLAGHMFGLSAVVDTGVWGTYAWADMISTAAGYRVAGGTDEILRNILGERVLGLPKEPGHT
ncbi:MAG: acyl-CoA dehydrogenase [Acidimicrobiales bacterium]|nr:acyl-CoA dehydrogenase [Acidimicrobiales bacterium]